MINLLNLTILRRVEYDALLANHRLEIIAANGKLAERECEAEFLRHEIACQRGDIDRLKDGLRSAIDQREALAGQLRKARSAA